MYIHRDDYQGIVLGDTAASGFFAWLLGRIRGKEVVGDVVKI